MLLFKPLRKTTPLQKEPQQRSMVLFSYLSKSVHETNQSTDQEKCRGRRGREAVFCCFSQTHYPITKERGGPENLGSISIPKKWSQYQNSPKELKTKNQNQHTHAHTQVHELELEIQFS